MGANSSKIDTKYSAELFIFLQNNTYKLKFIKNTDHLGHTFNYYSINYKKFNPTQNDNYKFLFYFDNEIIDSFTGRDLKRTNIIYDNNKRKLYESFYYSEDTNSILKIRLDSNNNIVDIVHEF